MSETEKPERERIAVLEHRADSVDRVLERISEWMRELTSLQTEQMRLQTEQIHNQRHVEKLDERVSKLTDDLIAEREARRDQHTETAEWAASTDGLSKRNSGWIDYIKATALAGGAAALTVLISQLFKGSA